MGTLSNEIVPEFEGALYVIGDEIGMILRKPGSQTTISQSYYIQLTPEQVEHIKSARKEWE